jgi:hypothetical protein
MGPNAIIPETVSQPAGTGSFADCGVPGSLLGCSYQLLGTPDLLDNTVADVVAGPPTGLPRTCTANIYRTETVARTGPNGPGIRAIAICRT